ncbi:hypothetical protein I4U23_005568 [Adineta vaga]|nr:hypothetical protein I4U23_005568 [Adineta vaga]
MNRLLLIVLVLTMIMGMIAAQHYYRVPACDNPCITRGAVNTCSYLSCLQKENDGIPLSNQNRLHFYKFTTYCNENTYQKKLRFVTTLIPEYLATYTTAVKEN